MANPYFRFKQFTVHHDRCAMKVTTDACLFGAWVASREAGGVGRALDIGAGTGLLALMVAQKGSFVTDAVEIDAEAAAQARENVAASPWKDRIFVHTSGIQMFPGTGYTLIFSNPPFYESDLRSGDGRKNLAHHSTELTLESLVSIAEQKLEPEGRLYLLMPARREEETRSTLMRSGLFIHHLLRVRQSETHGFFRLMVQCGRREAPVIEEELSITDSAGRYTDPFVRLLQPYYLYL